MKLTLTDIINEAKKFNKPIDWIQGSPHSYRFAYRNNLVQLVYNKMKWKSQTRFKWDLHTCLKSAKKYESKSSWRKGEPSAWRIAHRDRFMKKIENLLGDKWSSPDNFIWTYENCLLEAKRFNKAQEWRKLSPGSWFSAWRNGWLPKIKDELFKGKI